MEKSFKGLRHLLRSKWRCIDISSSGMMLEAKGSEGSEFFHYIHWLIKSFFARIQGKTHPKVYYPLLPPEQAKLIVEMKIPRTNTYFKVEGTLVWFKPLWRGVYRMGINFGDGTGIAIHQFDEKETVIVSHWKEAHERRA